ncbi:LacI family DNA-binding transcriptional regulator [Oceanicola granulosus]|uniref:LacI family DNA-binding transcriptional regulator n=1 Tax=Oceanicola granulosus TaxID=252302 RepID=UPI0002DF2456|nr:LacI family DNA-binding transcriptional regulator [Oceanicola granulosus]
MRAGVSQATVSTFLAGGDGVVASETAHRIEAAIAELGYTPNRFARALRTQRSMVVACVVPDITNPFYPALFAAAQATMGSEYDVVAINTGGAAEAEDAVIAAALQGRYDGLVGVFFTRRASDFADAVRAGVAVARIEAHPKAGGALAIDDVFVDNRRAAAELTQTLLDLGHRRIEMIAAAGGPETVRVEGYRAAMDRAGREAVVHTARAYSAAGGAEVVQAMLRRDKLPTALLAANDLMAIGALRVLGEAGVAVPGDVSVAGFDDIMPAALAMPQLTTVALHQDDLGARAAGLLLARLTGAAEGPGRVVEMPFDIVARASIGPPAIQDTQRRRTST